MPLVVLAAVVTVALGAWIAVSGVMSYLNEPVAAHSGVVTESSRPLESDVVKAPVDWTGDGVADGWAFGEFLPGDAAVVYTNSLDESVREPTLGNTAGFIFLAVLATVLVAGAAAFGTWFAASQWGYSAAERDWDDAAHLLRTHPAYQGSGS